MSKRKPVFPGERFPAFPPEGTTYLTAIEPDRLDPSGSKGKKKAKVWCVCSCEEKNQVDVWVDNLRSGKTTSCNCHQASVRKKHAENLSKWRASQPPKWTLGRIRTTDVLKHVDILDDRPDDHPISQRDEINVQCKTCSKISFKDAVEIERHPEACQRCSGKEPWTAKSVRDATKSRRTLLDSDGVNIDTCPDDTLINLHDRRYFRCGNCQSVVKTSVMTAVRLKSHHCKKCKPDKQWDLGRFRREVGKKSGKVIGFKNELDNYLILGHKKIEVECEYGHRGFKTANHIRDVGTICNECSSRLSERTVRSELQALFNAPFPSSRPQWLVSPKKNGYKLELDGYSPSLSLAFEHDGPQHYGVKIRAHQTDEDLRRIQVYDQHKDNLCKQHGVSLIRIPTLGERLPRALLRSFILDKCRDLKINVPFPNAPTVVSVTPDDIRYYHEFKQLVKGRGGTVLAERYLGSNEKLEVQCAEGHTFSIAPHKLKDGRWCLECYAERLAKESAAKYGFNDYRERLVGYLAESESSLVAPNSGAIKASTTVEITCRCGAARTMIAASVLTLEHHGLCRSCWQKPA